VDRGNVFLVTEVFLGLQSFQLVATGRPKERFRLLGGERLYLLPGEFGCFGSVRNIAAEGDAKDYLEVSLRNLAIFGR
jgi:hypothetical protein